MAPKEHEKVAGNKNFSNVSVVVIGGGISGMFSRMFSCSHALGACSCLILTFLVDIRSLHGDRAPQKEHPQLRRAREECWSWWDVER